MRKTNVHIPGISSCIVWLISILNWFKWPFFLLWKNQTVLVCAGQPNQETLEPLDGVTHRIAISFGCDILCPGFISGEEGAWQMRGERKVGVNLHLSSLTSYRRQSVTSYFEDEWLQQKIPNFLQLQWDLCILYGRRILKLRWCSRCPATPCMSF